VSIIHMIAVVLLVHDLRTHAVSSKLARVFLNIVH
jgi:hypothetical protein